MQTPATIHNKVQPQLFIHVRAGTELSDGFFYFVQTIIANDPMVQTSGAEVFASIHVAKDASHVNHIGFEMLATTKLRIHCALIRETGESDELASGEQAARPDHAESA